MAKLGNNVDVEIKGNIMTIKVDISKRGDVSKSVKSIGIATTNGNKEAAPGVVVGLNVYTPNR